MRNGIITFVLAIMLASCSPMPAPTPEVLQAASIEPTLSATTPTITPAPEPEWGFLSELQPNLATAGYWTFSIGKYPASEGSMVQNATIHNGEQAYPHGLFAAAPSNLRYDLKGQYQAFKADIFIDQSMVCDSDGALFQVFLDGELIYSQHMDAPKQAPSEVQPITLDVRGGNELLLHTDPGERGDTACDATIWGEPMLLSDPTPQAAVPPAAPLQQQPALTRELERFTTAMRAAGAIDAERSISYADVQVAGFKDMNGQSYETAYVHLDPDPEKSGETFEGDYPLMIRENGEWKTVGLRFWAQANRMGMALPLIANESELDDPTYPLKLLEQNATQLVLYVNISPEYLFSDFDGETWRQVLDNWETIQQQLDQGVLPEGFSYHWEGVDRVIGLAKEMNMDVRIGEIMPTSFAVPQEIVTGQFSDQDLEKLYEFLVRVPVLKYKGEVGTWLVVTESTGWLSSGRGPEDNWGFPFLQLGGVDIMEKAYGWAHATDPQANLILADDYILLNKMVSEYGATQPGWNNVFFNTISELKKRNVPVTAIDIENNFWIYNPPEPAFMSSQLEKIKALGYLNYAPEVTVLVSEAYPHPSIQSKKEIPDVSNPEAAQAQIYQQTLQTYLDLGIPWFGLGGLTDRFSFWRYSGYPETHAMVFDYNQQPKAAYYLLISTFYNHLTSR